MAGFRYRLIDHIPAFYAKTFAGIFRRHRVLIPSQPIEFEAQYQLIAHEYAKWHQVYQVEPSSSPFVFSMASPYIVLRYCDVFKRLGISYRHVLHLRSEMHFPNPGLWPEPGEAFDIKVRLDDLAYTSGNRIAVVIAVECFDQQQRCLLQARDFLFAKHVPQASIDSLQQSKQFNQTTYNHISKISKRTAQLLESASSRFEFVIPKDMGKQYGVLSGDFNPIHTSRLLMHCFGVKRLFIQGMCAWNWVMKTLVSEWQVKLSDLNMTYCNPMFVGQTIQLLCRESQFELVDKHGKLLAFGEVNAIKE